jgi:hypothetical protein
MLAPAELRERIAELRRLVEAERRDPATITIAYKAPLYDTELTDGHARRPFSGSEAQITDDIGVYADLGVHELIFDFRSEEPAQSLARMERFAGLVKLGRGAIGR